MSDELILENFINDILLPNRITCDFLALVEDNDDKVFWEDMFLEVLPDKIILTERTGGTSNLMKYQLPQETLNQVANKCKIEKIVFCFDSDNKHFYLPNDENELLKPNTFQTYTHSIENLKSNPKVLNKIYKDITLIHSLEFDFEFFFRDYSRIMYPALLYWIYFYKSYHLRLNNSQDNKEKKKINQAKDDFDNIFKSIIEIGKVKNDKPEIELDIQDIIDGYNLNELSEKLISIFEKRINDAFNQLDNNFSNYFYENFKEDIITELEKENLLFTEEDTFWYLRGHSFFDCFILPIFIKIVEKTKNIVIKSKNNQKEEESKINQYQNFVEKQDIQTLLYISYRECFRSYMNCVFVDKIKNDIQKIFV